MKVYLVCGGFAYEGEDLDSVRVFSSKEKAEQYHAKLSAEQSFGYVKLEERELDVE